MTYFCKLLIVVSLFEYATATIVQSTNPASVGNDSGSGGTSGHSVG